MFWRFGFHTASAIDGLLDKEGVTLEDLFEEEELLQECKSHNTKLVEFLCKPDILSQLVGLITREDLEESKRYRYPYVASEIFNCEIFALCEAMLANTALLESLWAMLDRPAPMNSLSASNFMKVNIVLFSKKTAEMVTFIKNQSDVIEKLLNHIGTSAIADVLLKLITVDDVPEGSGIVEWLSQQQLIPKLIEKFNPTLDTEVHNTASQTLMDIIAVSYQNVGVTEQEALGTIGGNKLVEQLKSEEIQSRLVSYMLEHDAPNATNTLTNGINIIIELIRRFCSEIEQAEYLFHQLQMTPQHKIGGPAPPSNDKLRVLATDLNDLLRVLARNIPEFAALLTSPRNVKGAVETTIGKQVPLGSERLKTCELFAEVLHLQYLFASSPLFERLIISTVDDVPPPPKDVVHALPQTTGEAGDVSSLSEAMVSASLKDESTGEASADPNQDSLMVDCAQSERTVSDELTSVSDFIVQAKVLPLCLDLFFNFPWNNFLHSVVYDMVAKVFNTYSYISTQPYARPGDFDNSTSLTRRMGIVEEKMKNGQDSVRKLVITIFVDGHLTKRITEAQRQNDYAVEQPKGVRLGFMGHLTYIADEVVKLIEKCQPDFAEELKDYLQAEDWQEYVSGILRETKERDRQPLGGVRPSAVNQHVSMVGEMGSFAAVDEADTGVRTTNGAVAASKLGGDSDDEDDEGMGTGEVYVSDGDVASDQFARYLAQQMVNDLPNRLLGGDESDDEEENPEWIGEFGSRAGDNDSEMPMSEDARVTINEAMSDSTDLATQSIEPGVNEVLTAVQTGWADFSGAFGRAVSEKPEEVKITDVMDGRA
ncbi:SIT4 phosphatase-associated protein-domain-containing protein [Cladochytrium replicatum]|nr:SIT4 phosphatase-associated protein-domain-containing protein [Cladochytrium replicatum]